MNYCTERKPISPGGSHIIHIHIAVAFSLLPTPQKQSSRSGDCHGEITWAPIYIGET